MASSTINNVHKNVVDFGGVNTMPTSFSNHGETYLAGFILLSNATIGNETIPAGTRCFGYYGNNFFHGIGIPNQNKIYIFRFSKDTSTWSVLGSK